MKEIPPPAPLEFTPSYTQEDTEVKMLEKSNDELLEKSKDAEESGTESATSENDDSEAIDLEGGLVAVKKRKAFGRRCKKGIARKSL